MKLYKILFFISLMSCSSVQDVEEKYYILSTFEKTKSSDFPSKLLKLNLSSVPAYLKQSKLVLVDDLNQMIVANHHLWAEDVEVSIKRVIRAEVNNLQDEYGVVHQCRRCGEVQVDIDHFYATTNGRVFLNGSFRYIPFKGKERLKPFSFEKTLGKDGYLEMVKVMSSLLKDLSDEISINVKKK